MDKSLSISRRHSPQLRAEKRRRLDESNNILNGSRLSYIEKSASDGVDGECSLSVTKRATGTPQISPLPIAETIKDTVLKGQTVFNDNASLVLVGRKGSGLSSLAVIAAKALRFRVLDVENWFSGQYGMSSSTYVQKRGMETYLKDVAKTFDDILQQYSDRYVVVCGLEILQPPIQRLLQVYAKTHPVIMVNRDLDAILKHLRLQHSDELFQVLERSQKIYRQISNLEFFNLPEDGEEETFSTRLSLELGRCNEKSKQISLLQSVKQDLIKFLGRTRQTSRATDSLVFPISPEDREYTNALYLPLEAVDKENFDLRNVDCSFDAVELVISLKASQNQQPDLDKICRCFQTVRRQSSSPIIYHINCEDEDLTTLNTQYFNIIYHGLRLLPDYITINLASTDQEIVDIASITKYTKLIGHRSYKQRGSFSWTSPSIHQTYDRAVGLGCHAVRIVRMAQSPSENRDCYTFTATVESRCNVPIIAYNLGFHGKTSMVLSSHLTPVAHKNLLNGFDTMSLLNPQEKVKALFSTFIYQPLHLHIFGSSVNYSLSPAMHNAGFRCMGLEHQYLFTESQVMPEFLSLVDDTFGGASISLPFKSDVLPLLDSMSEAARTIQAVNTILPIRKLTNGDEAVNPISKLLRNRAGPVQGLHGENTDWIALYSCISRRLSPANAINNRTTALIIGAGGMARATVYAMARLGVQTVIIWNRTYNKALKVAEHFNTSFHTSQATRHRPSEFREATPCNDVSIRVLESLDDSWPKDLLQPTIIVCTIPAHQIGDTPPPNFTIPNQWFKSATGGVIVELSYKLSWTPLLQQAYDNAHKGWVIVEPLEILIEQGFAQFELFTGYPAPRKVMRESTIKNYVAMQSAQLDTESGP